MLAQRIKCRMLPNSSATPSLPNANLLLPSDLTAAQLLLVVRRHLRLAPAQALFLFSKGTAACGTVSVTELLHSQGPPPDGVLEMRYAFEDAFGSAPPHRSA